MEDKSITELHADALSIAIHARKVSCKEVMSAYLARIHRLNPIFNAIVNLSDDDDLLIQAAELDAELALGHSRGWMHGMPQAIKDTGHAIGYPTTLGNVLLQHSYPTQDSIFVKRMKAAGCIVIGKTNVPEFALGSNTYNSLFGITVNAWNQTLSAGGSSGGAAVAVAQRMLPVADGSDFMGSVRNPAGWNNIFGFRPSQGLVPGWPKSEVWLNQIGTVGTIARTVNDLSKLLSTIAGRDARDPLSIVGDMRSFAHCAQGGDGIKGQRIGWLGDISCHLAVESGIINNCESALARMVDAGAIVEPLFLGFDPEQLWNAWLIWRRALIAPTIAQVLKMENSRDHIKPEALWEYDNAKRLTFDEFENASIVRSDFLQHMLSLFERYDFLALPVAQVWPYDINQTWPRSIGGRLMDTYNRWMESAIYAAFIGAPAISVPAGFAAISSAPIGLQLIARPQNDTKLLVAAATYETLITDLLMRKPPELFFLREGLCNPHRKAN